MKNLIHAMAAASAALLVSGCGGGGDGSADGGTAPTQSTASTAQPSTTADKYAGTWAGCFPTGPASSRRETLVITAQGPDSAAFSFSETSYAQTGCAGPAGATSSDSGTVAFAGTKTIGGATVDKGTVTEAGSSQKQVFLATATTLQVGRQAGDGGTLDADGYPETFDSNALTRQ